MSEVRPTEQRAKGHGWREIPVPAMPDNGPTRAYQKGPCRVLVSREDHRNGRPRWHLSISCADRYPGWNEIKDARYSLLPLGLTFAQILPPPQEFVNIHPNCFHLWEIDHAEW